MQKKYNLTDCCCHNCKNEKLTCTGMTKDQYIGEHGWDRAENSGVLSLFEGRMKMIPGDFNTVIGCLLTGQDYSTYLTDEVVLSILDKRKIESPISKKYSLKSGTYSYGQKFWEIIKRRDSHRIPMLLLLKESTYIIDNYNDVVITYEGETYEVAKEHCDALMTGHFMGEIRQMNGDLFDRLALGVMATKQVYDFEDLFSANSGNAEKIWLTEYMNGEPSSSAKVDAYRKKTAKYCYQNLPSRKFAIKRLKALKILVNGKQKDYPIRLEEYDPWAKPLKFESRVRCMKNLAIAEQLAPIVNVRAGEKKFTATCIFARTSVSSEVAETILEAVETTDNFYVKHVMADLAVLTECPYAGERRKCEVCHKLTSYVVKRALKDVCLSCLKGVDVPEHECHKCHQPRLVEDEKTKYLEKVCMLGNRSDFFKLAYRNITNSEKLLTTEDENVWMMSLMIRGQERCNEEDLAFAFWILENNKGYIYNLVAENWDKSDLCVLPHDIKGVVLHYLEFRFKRLKRKLYQEIILRHGISLKEYKLFTGVQHYLDSCKLIPYEIEKKKTGRWQFPKEKIKEHEKYVSLVVSGTRLSEIINPMWNVEG